MMHHAQGLLIYQNDGYFNYSMSALRFIKQRCEQAYFTYEGYIKACKRQLNRSYRIPVVIDDETMLIPLGNVKAYETIWINYPAIKEIKTGVFGIHLLFISGRELIIDIHQMRLQRQIDDLIEIRNTKVKHFHGR